MGNGKRGKPENGTPPGGGKFSLISDEKLISLYRNLLRSRNGTGGAPRVEPAAVVGTAIDLGAGDVVCSLDVERLTALSGADAIGLLLGSKANGQAGKSRGTNGHSACPFAHAVIGTALANKTAKNGRVAVIYSAGDSEYRLREVIHIAAVHGLPMVFVQQLDGTGRSPRAKAKTSDEGTPWYPSITVDTNDVVAVYRVANESISRARLGQGPTLIECRAYHISGSRNGIGPHAHDPVLNMEHYLRAKGLFASKLK